jgi:hypothetical protein
MDAIAEIQARLEIETTFARYAHTTADGRVFRIGIICAKKRQNNYISVRCRALLLTSIVNNYFLMFLCSYCL